MKLMRQFVTSSFIVGSMLLPVGSALADTINLDAAGPGSSQDVTINNSVSVVETNVSLIEVSNTNVQQGTTGDVAAANNTSVGGVSSGSASNSNGTTTTVTVGGPASSNDEGGAGEGAGEEADNAGPSASGNNGQSSGSVLGSATTGVGLGAGLGGGVALLPSVGPSQPVDVSALRAAWHPNAGAPHVAAVQQPRTSSLLMYVLAALLGLASALGGLAHVRQQKEGSK